MAGVEKDHNDHLLSTPCFVQGLQPPDQAAQSHIQPGLELLTAQKSPLDTRPDSAGPEAEDSTQKTPFLL